jgi:hypothetical protein
MREAAIGFFDLYLRQRRRSSVPELAITTERLIANSSAT